MPAVVLVAVAGAAGAAARYGVALLAARHLGERFAFGTLAVNVLGCLALGLLVGGGRSGIHTETQRLLLGVGFLGAFTTFSAFGYETVRFAQQGAGQLALLNVAANLVLGLGAMWLGMALARA